MNDVVHWYSMGGYGVYVWSTYGLVMMSLIISVVCARRQRIRTRHKLKQWFNRTH